MALDPAKVRSCICVLSVFLLAAVGLIIACLVDSRHTIQEGNVGIYFRNGALQDWHTKPGIHWKSPFIERVVQVQVRSETVHLEPVEAVTKDGIKITYKEIEVMGMVKDSKVVSLTRKYGEFFRKALLEDRIRENVRYCSC